VSVVYPYSPLRIIFFRIPVCPKCKVMEKVLEAVLLDLVGDKLSGLELEEARLRVLPGLVTDLYDLLLVLFNPFECCLFRHFNALEHGSEHVKNNAPP
jgi:hypothetical protein